MGKRKAAWDPANPGLSAASGQTEEGGTHRRAVDDVLGYMSSSVRGAFLEGYDKVKERDPGMALTLLTKSVGAVGSGTLFNARNALRRLDLWLKGKFSWDHRFDASQAVTGWFLMENLVLLATSR